MFILCLLWAKDPGSFPPTWTPGRPATLVVKAVLCPVVWPWRCCVVCVCMCSLCSNAGMAALQGDTPQAPLSLPFSLVRRKSSLGFVGACDRFLTFSGGSAPGLRLFLTSLCWSLRLGCGSLQIPHLSSWGSSAGTCSPSGSPAPELPAGFSWVFPPRLHPGLPVSTQLAGASVIFTLFLFLWGCCTLQPDVKCMKILVLFNLYGFLVFGKGRLNLVSFNYDQSRDLLPLYFMNIFMIRNFRCLFVFPLAVWTCRSETRECLPFCSFVCNGFPL